MKELTEEQFRANGKQVNKFAEHQIAEANDRAAEIAKFWPTEVLYTHSEQEGKLFYEYTTIYLKHPTLKIAISYDGYRKKYSIYCTALSRVGDKWSVFPNISHYTVENEKKKLQEPNRIGVLTTKKIQQWVTYYEQLYTAIEKINKENGSEKEQFLNSIKKYSPKFWNDGKNGEIIRNGIIMKFEVSETYVSKRIEVYYEVGSELKSWEKLSDNKYKSK